MKIGLIKNYCFSLLICFLSFSTSAFAQEVGEIRQIANKMFEDMNSRDYDAILEMTHPKVFEIISKDQMKTVLKSTFEGGNEYSIEIPKETPDFKISKIFKESENNLSYAFITYDMTMKMTFHNQTFDDEAKKVMAGVMKSKDMDVTFISNNAMNVLMNNRMTIVLKDKVTKNKWVMINYDPDSPLFYQILSSVVLEKAKTYKQDLMLENKKKQEN
ncbi:conserved exported protein of unknown function [Tenacibaculum jejuense]|uniref:Uncharacterized protein n=2 Tax=Tenacibaculum jejuense TaxID=584609 RepID=A0A238U7A3_9FLAO|nr:conserved exported protein of unknown function [Tenacibaculum jejuense]